MTPAIGRIFRTISSIALGTLTYGLVALVPIIISDLLFPPGNLVSGVFVRRWVYARLRASLAESYLAGDEVVFAALLLGPILSSVLLALLLRRPATGVPAVRAGLLLISIFGPLSWLLGFDYHLDPAASWPVAFSQQTVLLLCWILWVFTRKNPTIWRRASLVGALVAYVFVHFGPPWVYMGP